VEVGKSCLGSAVGVLLDEESIAAGKHLELLADKAKLLSFLEASDFPELARWAATILGARDNFLEVRREKEQVYELYAAAYNVLDKVFQMALSKVFGGN